MVRKSKRKKERKERKRRKLSKDKYFYAFVIATLIFVVGVLIGIFITDARINYLENIVYSSKLESQSLQLQLLYSNFLTEEARNCDILNSILERNLEEVGRAEKVVDRYIRESEQPQYRNYKRDYLQTVINYWILYHKTEEVCPMDRVAILYFYSNDYCTDCGPQGTILEYMKKKFDQDLLLFWIDADFVDEPMVSILKEKYNVTELPTLVLEDEVIYGFINKDDLLDRICSYLPKHEQCK